ncbi:MAG: glutamyl-tRNA reductase [Planctomycetaceae bacterium]|jgi:glutamyl-tRNA reductase|nr:glutamyl-tRNA reductase [Planctomycetaceae bacterium]MBT4011321.1 glutamyl-tRNA reductase [Planctomycetaceae bacterium]MBT4725772.1 glutamyl-tRNA reductase [Planctomycetaceae bacterium]MBT5124308.1 glutamyl-tRNA reductase [Planctomycetaceae bacterium]MBT5597133.1 glutamyl-tRNA reductase [Planctomycetaceae bacterium]
MKVQMIGCSHHNTDVTFREQLAFQPTQVTAALAQMRRLFPRTEAVLLSTCNRMELYTAAEDEADCPTTEQLIAFVAEFHGLVPQDIAVELLNLSGEEAVLHLFSTAASLNSMVVGEAQILSQIKQAYDLANAGNSTGPLTHSTFQAALRVAKRVQNETSLHEKRVSIPSIAVADYASQFFERLDDKVVLIIGAGEMAQETLTYLVDKNVGQTVIVNRSRDRADQLAKQTGSEAADWDQLENLLAAADLVVSATAATDPVVTSDLFHQVVEKRFQRPIFILDLAVPRDFEAAISEFINVYLYSIDDIQAVCDANLAARQLEWPKAENIIAEETALFMKILFQRVTGPWIGRLKQQANDIKEAELQRLQNKLGSLADDPAVTKELEISLDRLVNKLLHPPLESLREDISPDTGAGLLDALKKLFQLKD